MIRSISIKNFRGFKAVEVGDCRRINIIVGENGSGKTALLEGMFLALGASPELAMRTRAWRGAEETKISGTIEAIHLALFADLFHRMDTSNTAVVSLRGTGKDENRAVTVRYYPTGKKIQPPPRHNPSIGPSMRRRPPIEFEWKIDGAIEHTASAQIDNGRLEFPPTPASIVRASFLAANRTPPSNEAAERFSQLSRQFKQQDFIAQYSKLYPHVTDLSVEVSIGVTGLFAKVRDLPEKIPISLASGGMSKIATILLAIAVHQDGVVIIDEIENGFYYKNMPNVWRAVAYFADYYNCQIFASTHSAECLEAAATLAEAAPTEFGVMHTYWKDGEAKVLQFGGDKFAAAMAEDIEIR